jgi:predicted Zn-dependent protease with MMP-like domain
MPPHLDCDPAVRTGRVSRIAPGKRSGRGTPDGLPHRTRSSLLPETDYSTTTNLPVARPAAISARDWAEGTVGQVGVAWASLAPMIEVDPERFDVMVSEALDGIPGELGQLMSNVAVTVQHDGGPAGLLGLYQGVPLTRRSTFYAGALPDRITIYRRAICAVCTSESEVVEQVRRTVIHEVGHHFGIGDARLRELGW